MHMVNICPVCGYPLQWPAADFHICPSCGTEFGYDDAGRSHADLRAAWIQGGSQWWSTSTPPPTNWNATVQLENLDLCSNSLERALYGTLHSTASYKQAAPGLFTEIISEKNGHQQGEARPGLTEGPSSFQKAFAA